MNKDTDNTSMSYVTIPLIIALEDLTKLILFSKSTIDTLTSDRSSPLIEIGTQSFILRDSLIDWRDVI